MIFHFYYADIQLITRLTFISNWKNPVLGVLFRIILNYPAQKKSIATKKEVFYKADSVIRNVLLFFSKIKEKHYRYPMKFLVKFGYHIINTKLCVFDVFMYI